MSFNPDRMKEAEKRSADDYRLSFTDPKLGGVIKKEWRKRLYKPLEEIAKKRIVANMKQVFFEGYKTKRQTYMFSRMSRGLNKKLNNGILINDLLNKHIQNLVSRPTVRFHKARRLYLAAGGHVMKRLGTRPKQLILLNLICSVIQ